MIQRGRHQRGKQNRGNATEGSFGGSRGDIRIWSCLGGTRQTTPPGVVLCHRERQAAFKNILLYGDIRDIILLARKLKFKQDEQESRGKKLHIADERTFREAEKIISEELAYALGIEKDKVIDFLVSKLEK